MTPHPQGCIRGSHCQWEIMHITCFILSLSFNFYMATKKICVSYYVIRCRRQHSRTLNNFAILFLKGTQRSKFAYLEDVFNT